jgi:hypothetical protein
MTESHVPPGWSENPSELSQRLPIVGLALIAFAIAGYLALFQYDVLGDVFEPFFGDGSRIILTSDISYLLYDYLYLTDAALGAFAYLFDAVVGSIGGRERWRTMPWLVILFVTAVIATGITGVTLVILQPTVFDAWCTLCIATAIISIAMVGPAVKEILASLQHLKRVRSEGGSAWKALWGLGERSLRGEEG